MKILFGTVQSGKSHLESQGFAKDIKNEESDVSNQKRNLIGKVVFVFVFYFLIVSLDVCG